MAAANIGHAASLLTDLKRQRVSWTQAAAHYHAWTNQTRWRGYACKG